MKKMDMIISSPSIREGEAEGTKQLYAEVMCGNWKKELWYEVSDEMAKGFSTDNVDAFVLAILPWCMTNSSFENVICIKSDSKISKQLSLQLKMLFIPMVAKFTKNFNYVEIAVDTYENDKESGKAVLSGVSGGVDSFYTLMRYTQPDCDYPITHGICANMGVYGGYDSTVQIDIHNAAIDVCKAMNLELIDVKSNILLDVYKKQMATNVSFVYMSMGLALQNLVHIYYFSSDVDAEKFNFSQINAEEYDLLNCPMFGNGRVLFYSAGSEVTRMEKINYISEFPVTYTRIHVCPYPVNGHQCQKCEKCTETMTTLDVLGKLDRYSEVYDIEDYKKNYSYHWGYILLAPKTMPNLKEILDGYKEKHGNLPISAYIACVNKWIKRGFTKDNKKRIEMKDIIDNPF